MPRCRRGLLSTERHTTPRGSEGDNLPGGENVNEINAPVVAFCVLWQIGELAASRRRGVGVAPSPPDRP